MKLRSRRGRALCLLLLAFYSLAGARLLAPALDWLLPRAITALAADDFPCRFHNCGCLSAEQCRDHCCCVSVTRNAEPAACCAVEPPDEPEQRLHAAKCYGGPSDPTLAQIDRHDPLAPVSGPDCPRISTALMLPESHLLQSFLAPPDGVPWL